MPAYDSLHFDPPAPLAHVVLRDPVTGTTQHDVSMLLDSGADVTLVPLAAVVKLGVTPDPNAKYEVSAFDGTRRQAQMVRLELTFCRRIFRGEFLVIDQEYGILGRNVLNVVPLLLDGPRLHWDEHPARP